MTKQKQRGHGEGSIYQRPDGRWVGQVSLEDGKRKYLYGKTRKEVADKLHQALQEQKQGILATGPQQNVAQCGVSPIRLHPPSHQDSRTPSRPRTARSPMSTGPSLSMDPLASPAPTSTMPAQATSVT